jgi:UDP-N-acetylmuramyl pentapeptide phosphotransferase/UDP-N-acetylglucosamine-1-phosphate transferase
MAIFLVLPSALVLSAILSFWLTAVIRPSLLRYALAKPNARSSHKIPTPQGAGTAVIIAVLIITALALTLAGIEIGSLIKTVFAATLSLAVVGAIDDVRPINALPRLLCHALAVGAILMMVPAEARIVPQCPLGLERGVLLVAGVWFVNLVNFMDGLDWMTVAEAVPVAGVLAAFGIAGHFSPATAIAMATLCGAMLGFAPFNRPVAKIFLGDVGSLPIGLLLGWGLLELAMQGHISAALLLPLYYLADATVTILRRALNRERVWTAHRTHFYQRATDNGLTVIQVVRTVFLLNLVLAALAAATIVWNGMAAQLTAMALGVAVVTMVLVRFSRSRRISNEFRHSVD